MVLLGFLTVTVLSVVFLRDLFAIVMLFGIYSFLAAALFVTLDAVDVAFTEAAVGAGISTFLMLATLALTARREKTLPDRPLVPLLVIGTVAAALVYGTLDMPHFSDPQAPAHTRTAPYYIESATTEIGVPNIVTAVLASYRGYDTLGELIVIFTAGIGVIALIGYRKRGKDT
jgi:multicomponent Na+:H+ antiporter subunit B